MNQLTPDHLGQLAIDALERTAFVLAEPTEGKPADELPACDRFARIGYTGPSVGRVFLAASTGFVRELASSMLGVEPDAIDSSVDGQDALTEMANIVGGSVILLLGGAECSHALGLPEAVERADLPAPRDDIVRCCLDSEGERLEVIWAPDDRSSSAAA